MNTIKSQIISRLQQEILVLEGFKVGSAGGSDLGLGPINNAFPGNTFPIGAVHEFLSSCQETGAATCGFIAALLGQLMKSEGVAVWISRKRDIFPPALRALGIQPDKIIFLDLLKEKHVMWAVEEALKCGALSAVVGELTEISFAASRRLQLAVEQSKVTGFIVRNSPRQLSATACVSRWKVTPLLSHTVDSLPGVGFPRWNIELQRIRNGTPGVWRVHWASGNFVIEKNNTTAIPPVGETYPSRDRTENERAASMIRLQKAV